MARLLTALLILASLLPQISRAEDYPQRPVRLIVPYAAGGGTDAIARVVANGIGEKLGKTMVVDNMGTGGGNVATGAAANAQPDGYTVLMANQGPITVNPHLFKSLKVDTLKAFDPVTLIASAPLVVVVPMSSPYKSMSDLVEGARKDPGKLTYGSAGNGSASHLATILFTLAAKIDVVHVPYRGAGPAIGDLLGGQTQFMITTIPSVIGLIETNQMRALGVTSKQRSPLLKDIPTVAEAGFPDYEASAWYGLVVPHGTPRPIVDILQKATAEALKMETVQSRLKADGAIIVGNTPDEFGEFVKREHARWKDVIARSNIKLE